MEGNWLGYKIRMIDSFFFNLPFRRLSLPRRYQIGLTFGINIVTKFLVAFEPKPKLRH
jgi:hypothetical protein